MERTYFSALFVAAGLAIILAWVLASPALAIKGSYVLFGVVIAGVIYFAETPAGRYDSSSNYRPSLCAKVFYIAFALSTVVVALTRSRTVPLLVGLPILYICLYIQFKRAQSRFPLLLQLGLVFFFSPLTRYLSTGFYYGNGDTLMHVKRVENLLQTGHAEGIAGLYAHFPGLHILAGSVSTVVNIPAYDALMLMGAIAYFSGLLVIVALSKVLFRSYRTALAIGIAFISLQTTLIYSSYPFPQALTMIYYIILLYVGYQAVDKLKIAQRSKIVGFVIGAAAVFTHQLTHILFAIIAFGIVIAIFVMRLLSPRESRPEWAPFHQMTVLSIVVLAAFGYIIRLDQFILPLVGFSVRTFQTFTGILFGNPSAETLATEIHSFGVDVGNFTPTTAASSLASFESIYASVVVSLLVISTFVLLRNYREYRTALPLLLLGAIGTLTRLPSPLKFAVPARTTTPLVFFTALLLGLGIRHITDSTRDTSGVRTGVALSVLVVFSVSGGLVAADDVYALHAGPDLSERNPIPEPQVAFSEAEMEKLRSVAMFSRYHGLRPSSMWITKVSLVRYGSPRRATLITDQGLETETEILVYRTQWTDHRVANFQSNNLHHMLISRPSLTELKQRSDQVYSVGELGMLRSEDGNFSVGEDR